MDNEINAKDSGNGELTGVGLLYPVWGTVSAIASIVLMISILWNEELRNDIKIRRVLWMSFSDCGLALKFAIGGIRGVKLTQGSWECYASGISGTFFWWSTIGWYLAISMSVYYGIDYGHGDENRRALIPKIQHGLIWSISLIVAIIVAVVNGYGPVNDDVECWFRDDWPYMRLIDITPLFFSWCFAIYLFFFIWSSTKALGSEFRSQILTRMRLFVGVFVIGFSFALLDTIWGMVGSSWEYIGYVDIFFVIGSGVMNLVVWASSPKVYRAVLSCLKRFAGRSTQGYVDPLASGFMQDSESMYEEDDAVSEHRLARVDSSEIGRDASGPSLAQRVYRPSGRQKPTRDSEGTHISGRETISERGSVNSPSFSRNSQDAAEDLDRPDNVGGGGGGGGKKTKIKSNSRSNVSVPESRSFRNTLHVSDSREVPKDKSFSSQGGGIL